MISQCVFEVYLASQVKCSAFYHAKRNRSHKEKSVCIAEFPENALASQTLAFKRQNMTNED